VRFDAEQALPVRLINLRFTSETYALTSTAQDLVRHKFKSHFVITTSTTVKISAHTDMKPFHIRTINMEYANDSEAPKHVTVNNVGIQDNYHAATINVYTHGTSIAAPITTPTSADSQAQAPKATQTAPQISKASPTPSQAEDNAAAADPPTLSADLKHNPKLDDAQSTLALINNILTHPRIPCACTYLLLSLCSPQHPPSSSTPIIFLHSHQD
jgi:hypothetical protein